MEKIFFAAFILLVNTINLIHSQTDESIKLRGNLEWHTNLKEAEETSFESGKPVFAFFTGSDWCIWCRKMQENVFSKQEFIDWATPNVVLLELDFPRHSQLSEELTQQNNALKQSLRVNSYPTIMILKIVKYESANNYKFIPIGGLGYPDNPEPGNEQEIFLNNANKILATLKK